MAALDHDHVGRLRSRVMPPHNPYLTHYLQQRDHQREHSTLLDNRPHEVCLRCLIDTAPHGEAVKHSDGVSDVPHDVKRRYAWAIPNQAALDVIADWSPNGVVEIGAGAGYWTGLLREHGVDVVAYDPGPPSRGETSWHVGHEWSHVEQADHRAVTAHPDRTLLLVWPSYSEEWTETVVERYDGDTVVYVGEPPGGCTGTSRMHLLLGSGSCCCFDEPCTCPQDEARFRVVDDVDIPQWMGLHDRLTVHQRLTQ